MASVVTIFGYGSLLSYQSVLTTMPSASNFRRASLMDYSRNFNLVSINGLRTGTAYLTTLEMAAVTIRKADNNSPPKDSIVRGCIFDIPSGELASYMEREHRYIPIEVTVTDEETKLPLLSWTVIENTDERYRASMSTADWDTRIGQYYTGSLWGRTEIKPMRKYLHSCVSSARGLGGQLWLDSMLDSSLADGTSVREYIRAYPERFIELELGDTF